jgi:hypothetical protein
MNSSKQEDPPLVRDSQEVLRASRGLRVSTNSSDKVDLNKVEELLLEIYLKSLRSFSGVWGEEPVAARQREHKHLRVKTSCCHWSLTSWRLLMEHRRPSHLLGLMFVGHARAPGASLAPLLHSVEAVMDQVSKQSDKVHS